MRNKILIASVIFFFMAGCCPLRNTEFVDVCNDHKIVTIETCQTLINAIEDEIENRPEDEVVLRDLINRLQVILKQSVLIDEYVNAVVVDKELLARLLRNKWNKES